MPDIQNANNQNPQNEPGESGEPKVSSNTGWRDALSWIKSSMIFHPKTWFSKRALVNFLIILLFLCIAAMQRNGISHVKENQVGVSLNNLTGHLELKDRIGYHFYFPYLYSFFLLDKTIQKLDLSWAQGAAGIRRDIKFKTSDGSEVSMDITINFKLVPEMAVEVLQKSGAGSKFSETWMEPYTRHICFSTFGELTSEEMYDASLRNAKAQLALERLSKLLRPQGIDLIAVIPGEFRFYKEYEEVIQQKKLADQAVEEQKAQARESKQNQETQLVEERKKAETRLAVSEGECANKLIQSSAEANKKKREGDRYFETTLLTADAALYSASSEAEGLRANLLAEADGMEKIRKAMIGKGGANLVGMEYAKRLQNIRFTGTAVTRDPHIQQYSIQPGQQPVQAKSQELGPVLPPSAIQPQNHLGGGK